MKDSVVIPSALQICLDDVDPTHMREFVLGSDGRFCLSVKNSLTPKSGKGCSFKLYEKHNDFCTYEIEHTEKQTEMIFE